jgi:Sulfatase
MIATRLLLSLLLLASSLIARVQLMSTSQARSNILLFLNDQWRADWTDEYYRSGMDVRIPGFERMASDGTRFMRANVAAPLCSPSRACLATGKEYDESGVLDNSVDVPVNETTFYQLLQENGYQVLTTGKDDLTKPSGVGSDGSYRANQLGFTSFRRCLGKSDVMHHYPDPWDPYGIYLSTIPYDGVNNLTWFDELHLCMHNDCENHVCRTPMDQPQHDYEDNWVAIQSIELLSGVDPKNPWFMQVS